MARSGLIIILFATFVLYPSSISFAEDAENFVYDSRGKRDPFVPLITSQKTKVYARLENVQMLEDIILEGIVWDVGGDSIAILNGTIMGEGQQIGNVRIKNIGKKKITLFINDVEYAIDLITEGEKSDEEGE